MKKVIILFISAVILTGTSCKALNIKADPPAEQVGYVNVEYDHFQSAEDLAEKAVTVVEGTVTEIKNILVNEKEIDGTVHTSPRKLYTIQVLKTYKGEPKEELKMQGFGGVMDNIVYTETNAPLIREGQKYLFFLTEAYDGKVMTYNPAQSLVDLESGKSYDGSITLEDVLACFDAK